MPAAQAGPAEPAGVRSTADPDEVAEAVGSAVAACLATLELTAGERRLYQSMAETVGRLAAGHTDLVDLKLADAALAEMAEAFDVFRPFRSVRKITVFGSARTRSDHPAYAHTRAVAEAMAAANWMVVTGAGPGIMAAGMEGAGRDRSIGVNIRLPFEQGANRFIAQDPKLVEMRYFFTRKLMLVKESDGYVVLPGGFGTLDESYELLTLLQTGKAVPSPVVLLDVPGGTYWSSWLDFVDHELVPRGLIAPEDRALFRITDDVTAAVAELLGFYRNYQGCRWVGDLLVLRLHWLPTDSELEALNDDFADIVVRGRIRRSDPLPPERSSGDHLDQARLALRFDKLGYGRLRQLIDTLNRLPRPSET
ncbi:MAG: LOG family protein [Actinomycetota bacterium]|nr:LOG family protein [Actinomycetota bacterium]MDA8292983.1 LOG family protein [Actinomycetota bacterium]